MSCLVLKENEVNIRRFLLAMLLVSSLAALEEALRPGQSLTRFDCHVVCGDR